MEKRKEEEKNIRKMQWEGKNERENWRFCESIDEGKKGDYDDDDDKMKWRAKFGWKKPRLIIIIIIIIIINITVNYENLHIGQRVNLSHCVSFI